MSLCPPERRAPCRARLLAITASHAMTVATTSECRRDRSEHPRSAAGRVLARVRAQLLVSPALLREPHLVAAPADPGDENSLVIS